MFKNLRMGKLLLIIIMNILGESSDCQKQEEDSSKVDNTFEKIELRPRTNLTPGLF